MEKEVFIAFAIMSFMGWYASAISTKKTIKEIGIHRMYYPKKYILPNRTMRKIFGLPKKEIPKWLYRELLMSFVYITMFIMSTGMLIVFENKLLIVVVFFVLYIALWGIQILHTVVNLILFRK